MSTRTGLAKYKLEYLYDGVGTAVKGNEQDHCFSMWTEPKRKWGKHQVAEALCIDGPPALTLLPLPLPTRPTSRGAQNPQLHSS